MPIMLVTSIHAGVIAQNQEFLSDSFSRWRKMKCVKKLLKYCLSFDKNDTQASVVSIQQAMLAPVSYNVSKGTHNTNKI
jgi:hypothetical protein